MEDWSDDIYFQEKYGVVNEQIELGKAVHFVHECEYGKVIHTFIKRTIPLNDVGETFYDIRTPYGYGGPLIVKALNKELLLQDFEKSFSLYCEHNNIATEFIRFHPIAKNALDFQHIYAIVFDRHTVGTNLQISENPIETEFSKSCRNNIRRALRKGLSYSIIESPKNLDDFKIIYYETMGRNKATDFYYFGDEYFEKLLYYFANRLLVVNVFFEGSIVASGLYFISHGIVHIHLSGTLNEFLHLNPPYILRFAITEWAIKHGYKYLHHGGGRTNAENDSLFLFKKQFGLNTAFDYYIGEKIWNPEAYEMICERKQPGERVNDYIRRMQK